MVYIPPNANGIGTPTNSSPVVLPAITVGGTAKSTPVVNYEFLTDTVSGYFDALGYNWISLSISTSAGLTGGTINFGAYDNLTGTNLGMSLQDAAVANALRFSNLTVSASSSRHFEGPIHTRYIRVYMSVAAAGSGTITVTATLKNMPPAAIPTYSYLAEGLPAGANTFGRVTLSPGTTTTQVGLITPTSTQVTEIASGAITTTTTGTQSSVAPYTGAASFGMQILSVSGTGTVMDVTIQEYLGASYVELYHFERITTTSGGATFVTPVLRFTGGTYRIIRTVAGTSPSINMVMYKNIKSISGPTFRSFYDRSVDTSGTNTFTTSYYVHGCNKFNIAVSTFSVTSPATLVLQGSPDNVFWYNIQTLTTPTVGVTSTTVLNQLPKWVRVFVSSAGSFHTIDWIHINAYGPPAIG